MTRKEAIEFIKNIIGEESGRCIGKEGFYAELTGYHIEALEMAIQALSQEPTEKPMCDRNICLNNEYNGIGCDECIVNKAEQEPRTTDKMHQLIGRLKTERMSQAEFEQYAKEHGYIISTTNIIEQIRAEIEKSKVHEELGDVFKAHNVAIDGVLQIIDKYKGDKE